MQEVKNIIVLINHLSGDEVIYNVIVQVANSNQVDKIKRFIFKKIFLLRIIKQSTVCFPQRNSSTLSERSVCVCGQEEDTANAL
jgi:hypothetical protein